MSTTSETDTLKLDSTHWHEQIASSVAALDTALFPSAMVTTLRCVVPFDYSVWFVYRGMERPICVHDTFTPKQRIVFVEDYQEGPYLLDPFYKICADGREKGLFRLRDIAPDRFYHSEYYRSYYRRTGLAEEIAFHVELHNDMHLIISLMRAGTSTPFSDRNLNRLRRIEPIVYALASQHFRNEAYLRDHYVDGDINEPQVGSTVSRTFESFGKNKLTPRECEVVRMVLRGHSSESIGRSCGITTGTVKIHRKNIYAKLGISSQSELFSLFISEI